ncbi:hypothetical protein [Streptomyces sp. BA2]|uniref:hypothetical protein n=1 Tax=Streptomyces sp. BA2 TaxID=436595 RepID=UPI001323AB90|nr:hypothetical protein [Streptomyces sp. BA2]MWA12847.1 hypothetical protein [Streptomyces sp. BA2]
MNRSRTLPVAAVSMAAAAALLLSGCGGGDDKDSGKDKIAGADEGGKKSASPSSKKSDAPAIDRPEMKLPSDVEIEFAKANLSDPDQAAAATDAENFVLSIRHGIVKQDPEDAAYKFYSEYQGPAFKYAKDQIKKNVDAGYTVTGEQHFSGTKVDVVKKKTSAVVSFCSDATKFFSKEVKTEKVHRTKPSVTDFASWEILMTASDSNKGLWRAKQAQVRDGAEECRR